MMLHTDRPPKPLVRDDLAIPARPADDFARLVGLYRDGERLRADLRRLRARIARAAAYRADPNCHAGLAQAHLEQLRDRRSADLAASAAGGSRPGGS